MSFQGRTTSTLIAGLVIAAIVRGRATA